MAKILILGGGFGGLIAAERLSKTLGGGAGAAATGGHQITLVSPTKKFTFYPALVRLAFGQCDVEDITFDLQSELNNLNVRFVEGEALDIAPDTKRVSVGGADFNGELAYDYLVIALGRRLASEKIVGCFESAHHLLGTKSALAFGQAVEAFRKGHIIVGLAPESRLPVPVCETAFALAQRFEREIRGGEVSLSVVFPGSLEDSFGGAQLHRKLGASLERHGIALRTDFPVDEVTEKHVRAKNGETLPYDLLMLLPPFHGHLALADAAFVDDRDFVRVDDFMRVEGLEKVYAAGDVVGLEGPKLGYMAARQALVAAENIVAEIGGGAPHRIYHHEIAAIIDQGGADSLFLHYRIGDRTLYRLKEGKMWGRMKTTNNQLWEAVHEGLQYSSREGKA